MFFEQIKSNVKVRKAFKIIISNPNVYAPSIPSAPFSTPGAPFE